MSVLNIASLFHDEAKLLHAAREKCLQIHKTDIRAAGNEVEEPARDFFKRMLPKRFSVTHGHLIDCNGVVSPQLDIIISDNTSIPSLLTTRDGTHYVPADAAFAVGEIKSTYYSKGKYIEEFSDKLLFIREKMSRPSIPNSAYGGVGNESLMRDIFLGRPHKYLNPLFAFMLFVSSGTGDDEDVEKEISDREDADLPGVSVMLDGASFIFGRLEERNLIVEKYPALNDNPANGWLLAPMQGAGSSEESSIEGNHLATLYFHILNHLNETYLEPPDLHPYLTKFLRGRASTLRKLQKGPIQPTP
jgi:hypothetical protein